MPFARSPWSGYGWMGVSSASICRGGALPGHLRSVDLQPQPRPRPSGVGRVPLGLAIVGYLGTWLWRVASRVADSTALLALAALLALVSYAQVEFPLAYTFFLLPAGALAGLLSVRSAEVGAFDAGVDRAVVVSRGGAVAHARAVRLPGALERQLQLVRFDQARIGLERPRSASSPIRLLTQLDALLRFARTPNVKAWAMRSCVRWAMSRSAFRRVRTWFDTLQRLPSMASLLLPPRRCSVSASSHCRSTVMPCRNCGAQAGRAPRCNPASGVAHAGRDAGLTQRLMTRPCPVGKGITR